MGLIIKAIESGLGELLIQSSFNAPGPGLLDQLKTTFSELYGIYEMILHQYLQSFHKLISKSSTIGGAKDQIALISRPQCFEITLMWSMLCLHRTLWGLAAEIGHVINALREVTQDPGARLRFGCSLYGSLVVVMMRLAALNQEVAAYDSAYATLSVEERRSISDYNRLKVKKLFNNRPDTYVVISKLFERSEGTNLTVPKSVSEGIKDNSL